MRYTRARRYYALRRGWKPADARLYAFWAVLAKFPQAVGLATYWRRRLLGRRGTVIEYKGPARGDPRRPRGAAGGPRADPGASPPEHVPAGAGPPSS